MHGELIFQTTALTTRNKTKTTKTKSVNQPNRQTKRTRGCSDGKVLSTQARGAEFDLITHLKS